MGFDISTQEQQARAEARWMAYVSDGGELTVHFKIRPRDPQVVESLNTQYPPDEVRLRGGRRLESRSEERTTQWNRGYVAAHLEDWDVTQDGVKAPITEETVACLTASMLIWVIDMTLLDDLRDHEVPAPIPS